MGLDSVKEDKVSKMSATTSPMLPPAAFVVNPRSRQPQRVRLRKTILQLTSQEVIIPAPSLTCLNCPTRHFLKTFRLHHHPICRGVATARPNVVLSRQRYDVCRPVYRRYAGCGYADESRTDAVRYRIFRAAHTLIQQNRTTPAWE